MESGIYIRSKNTGRYWSLSGKWSALKRDAHVFPTAAAAKDYCIQAKLANAEIVVVRDALICMTVPATE